MNINLNWFRNLKKDQMTKRQKNSNSLIYFVLILMMVLLMSTGLLFAGFRWQKISSIFKD